VAIAAKVEVGQQLLREINEELVNARMRADSARRARGWRVVGSDGVNRSGLGARGQLGPRAGTEAKLEAIRKGLRAGRTQREIARELGVGAPAVNSLMKRWSLRGELRTLARPREIARELGISQATVGELATKHGLGVMDGRGPARPRSGSVPRRQRVEEIAKELDVPKSAIWGMLAQYGLTRRTAERGHGPGR
jgi:DNA-binding CsgD family transcriptional regulator